MLYAATTFLALTGIVLGAAPPDRTSSIYVRSLAPGRAILRPNRDETIVAVVKCIGEPTRSFVASLIVPLGVEILDDGDRRMPAMALGDVRRLEWSVRAQRPIQGSAAVQISDSHHRLLDKIQIHVVFEPPSEVPNATYVPEPRPAPSQHLVLSHYCPLWKYGAHSMGWDTIEPWPERKPAIGFYDEGEPEVADWHIKYALEHGVDGFIFTWDKIWLDPRVTPSLGAGLRDGFLQARYLDRFKFCINWADQYYASSREELLNVIFPFWLENYFKHPSYVTINNRPLLFVCHPDELEKWLGGRDPTRDALDELRRRCRENGFDGLTIIGCVPTAAPDRLKAVAAAGFDATSAYIHWVDLWQSAEKDREGIPTFSHAEAMRSHGALLAEKRRVGTLPDLVTVQMGWDSRPWHGADTPYYMAGTSVEAFERACREAKRLVDAAGTGLDGRIVVLDNWNEFGEGHFIEPSAGYGFGFLDAVRRVFTNASEPCVHLTPADVGLTPPDRIFEHCRGILHNPYGSRPHIGGNVAAWWKFDEEDARIAHDSSPAGLHALKHRVNSVPGHSGRAFQCAADGHAILGVDEILYPADGFTIEFRYRVNTRQDNVYVLNTAGEKNTGYGVSFRDGRLAFYVNWTQMVETPEELPLGKWTHVVAVCDNRELSVFVDGEEVVRAPNGQRVRPSHKGFVCIGAYGPGSGESFSGAIDELKIHARPLSPDEIRIAATVRP